MRKKNIIFFSYAVIYMYFVLNYLKFIYIVINPKLIKIIGVNLIYYNVLLKTQL